MDEFEAVLELTIVAVPEPDDVGAAKADLLEVLFDRLTEALLELLPEEPVVSGSLETGEITVAFVVEASSPRQAIELADELWKAAAQRAAIRVDGAPDLAGGGAVAQERAARAELVPA